MNVADKVRASGIECYLLFSTTREFFSDDEIALFREYQNRIRGEWSLDDPLQGWPRPGPILFTWKELRSFETYPGALREGLPEQHARGLRELAVNSAALYLDGANRDAELGKDEELFV